MKKSNTKGLFYKFDKVFTWEIRKRFFWLKIFMIPVIILLLFVSILPQDICHYMDQNLPVLVSIINVVFLYSIGLGLILLPLWWMVCPYGEKFYEMERTGDINTSTRILVRLLVNVIMAIMICTAGVLAEGAMEKFADANYSWFHINLLIEQRPFMILKSGVLDSLSYLFFFLWSYSKSHERHYYVSFFISMCFTSIFEAAGKDFSWMRLGQYEPPYWVCAGIWSVAVLLVSGFFFVRCVQMEEKEIEFWS